VLSKRSRLSNFIISTLISSYDEIFNLKYDFVNCVTAEHAFLNDDVMSADRELMTAVINLE